MHRITTGLAVAAVASLCGVALAQPLPVQRFPFKSGPATITSCSVAKNGNVVASNSLNIKYFQNERDRNLKSVTFRVRYAGKTVTVTNNGTFSYQAPIEVKSDQLDGAPFAGTHPQVCRVLTATFADGKTVNPPYDRGLDPDDRGMTPESRESGEPMSPAMPPAPEATPGAPTGPVASPAPEASPSP
ncbi:MAG: hypothetical protein GIX03_06995 [Candidatus Eremiobacteraeota bacterium]|nr:hypothetical protein [Candidatus Eremiobacteraeota bacterium]MBC5802739.1 hypothetical protein [Candidatus Eremiobacteraeota bacterium]MBC5822538.1 hypothetical protein [Candidatus Eremiobacteraeota bacterium]